METNVMKWLSEIFNGEENIPAFERNQINFASLKKMMECAKSNEIGKSCIASAQEAQISELKDETLQIKEVLNDLGLEVQCGAIASLVDVVAQTSEMLNLDDPGEVSINNALSDLRFKAAKLPLENHLKKTQQRKDTKGYIADSSLRNKTEQALNVATTEMALNREAIAKTRKKAAFMQEKQREYLDLQDKYVTVIRKNGFQKHISHDSAVEMQNNLKANKEEMDKVTVKLEAFKGLPPSLELASAKLAEKEKLLHDLTELLQKEIQKIHL